MSWGVEVVVGLTYLWFRVKFADAGWDFQRLDSILGGPVGRHPKGGVARTTTIAGGGLIEESRAAPSAGRWVETRSPDHIGSKSNLTHTQGPRDVVVGSPTKTGICSFREQEHEVMLHVFTHLSPHAGLIPAECRIQIFPAGVGLEVIGPHLHPAQHPARGMPITTTMWAMPLATRAWRSVPISHSLARPFLSNP